MEDFDYQYRVKIKAAETTGQLDKLSFGRIKHLINAQSEPEKSILLGMLKLIKDATIK